MRYKPHKYQAPKEICQKCGMPDHDHYWVCEKHQQAGNGDAGCTEC